MVCCSLGCIRISLGSENLLAPAARSCAQTCTLTCLAARSQVGLTCSRIGVRAGRPGRNDLNRGTPPSTAAEAHARDSLRGPLCPGSGATQPRAAAAAGAPAGLLPICSCRLAEAQESLTRASYRDSSATACYHYHMPPCMQAGRLQPHLWGLIVHFPVMCSAARLPTPHTDCLS